MSPTLERNALPTLLRDYLAPAAEVLVASVVPPPTAPTVLASHQASLLLALFRARHPHGRYLVMDALPPPALRGLGMLRPLATPLYGAVYPLCLKPAVAGALVQGLVLTAEAHDGLMLRESLRSMTAGAPYAGAYLLRGSFAPFFTAARSLKDVEGFGEFRAFVDTAEAQFRLPDALENLALRAGLAELSTGVEERALRFDTPEAFLADPVVNMVLLKGLTVDTRAALRRALLPLLEALPRPLLMPLVTGVLRGTKL